MQIVVTGGSSGVGAALVERLATSGHKVFNLDVTSPKSSNEEVEYVHCDLADEAVIDAALKQLPDTIDALANVAGIARAESGVTVLAVNFLGLRHLTGSLLERLPTHGSVVSVSSVAGRDWHARYDRLRPLLDTTSMSEGLRWCEENEDWINRDPYSFSKRCVTAYTLREAQLFCAQSKQINCVSPGVIDTPLYPQFEALMGEDQSDWMIAQAGRSATPDEIAQVIDMLISNGATYLNGADIPVDGGYSAGLESGWIDFADSPVMREHAKSRAVKS